jgi:hypothetical protein
MKTAMQELKIDIIIEKELGFITEHSCNRVLDYIDNLYFEKEKEQIADAFNKGKDSDYIHYEDWYNQTYNK